MNITKSDSPKREEKGVNSRFFELTKEEQLRFCSYMVNYGASFYTIRGRMTRFGFRSWEATGIRKLIRDYAPDYKGGIVDFWGSLDRKVDFSRYMVARGMCKTTVSMRFSAFDFKEWELIGIDDLVDEFKSKGL